MERTTVMLPHDVKARAVVFARKQGVSFGELVREALEFKIKCNLVSYNDPFFADKHYAVAKFSDISSKHDEYLYGE